MAVQVASNADRSQLVRRALQGNALFSAVSGSIALAGAVPVSSFLGIESAWVVAGIGAGVLAWAGIALWVSRETPLDEMKVKEIIAGDLAWVVASLLVIVSGWPDLTRAGLWTVAIIADVVLLIAILQYIGLRRLR